jgi:hypothetical protein
MVLDTTSACSARCSRRYHDLNCCSALYLLHAVSISWQASANLVAVAFVHAGISQGFNVSYSPASLRQQQQGARAAAATTAQFVPQLLPHSTQQAAGGAAVSRITHRLRWSSSDEADAAPHVHFESYSDGGQLLASWTVQSESRGLPAA